MNFEKFMDHEFPKIVGLALMVYRERLPFST
jgi:hypothetical protein